MLVKLLGLFCFQCLFYVFSQELELHVCNDVTRPPSDASPHENCTLLCGFYIHNYILPHGIQEVALCVKDEFTPILCQSDERCFQYHRGSYCKKVQCLCEADIRDRGPKQTMFFVDICVAASNWLKPHSTLVAFPWKTVFAVFGTLGLLLIVFMGFRWLYPVLRSSHHSGSRPHSECHVLADDNMASPLYPQSAQFELHHGTMPNDDADKPPSYETLTKVGDHPPSYEETLTVPRYPQSGDMRATREASSVLPQETLENRNESAVQLLNSG